MKRKERKILSGIEKGAFYLYRHGNIPDMSVDAIDHWLEGFWEATGYWNFNRIARICRKDTAWISDQIKNRVNPMTAAIEYKKTHI